MKRAILLLALPFLFVYAYGQGAYEINLANETIDLNNRMFYIESVMDDRIEQANIGSIRHGLMDSYHPVVLKDGVSNSLQRFFSESLPKGNAQIPIHIKVNRLKIGQTKSGTNELGFVDLVLDYYYEKKFVYSNKQHLEVTDYDVMKLHEVNIREALKKSLLEFSKSEWLTKMNERVLTTTNLAAIDPAASDSASSRIYFKPSILEEAMVEEEKRNITTIGYQIGGYSLIGFDYEIRFRNNLGVHFGAGFSGYTYGLMIHTSPKKNSPYFNVSFKDGGFGLLSTAGVEYGGRWILNKRSGFGLTFQYGIVKILKIDDAFSDLLYGTDGAPEFMMSMGVGLSW